MVSDSSQRTSDTKLINIWLTTHSEIEFYMIQDFNLNEWMNEYSSENLQQIVKRFIFQR